MKLPTCPYPTRPSSEEKLLISRGKNNKECKLTNNIYNLYIITYEEKMLEKNHI